MERRFLMKSQLRAAAGKGAVIGTLSGYAAVFNSLSENLGGFRERIAPGTFTRTLRDGADVRALWNHDASQLLGRVSSGTLKLREDDRGLRFELALPDTQPGRDVLASVRRGDLREASFSFNVVTDSWHRERGALVRELVDVDLYDISPVAFPAYGDTTVSERGLYLG